MRTFFVPTTKHQKKETKEYPSIAIKGKKILCVCDEGNNRSVTFSYVLRYAGNDTIPLGLNTSQKDTQEMLFKWADIIIITDKAQVVPDEYKEKVKLFAIEDKYPRPFNAELLQKVREVLR